MSSMIGESLSVTIQGENLQRILLMSSHEQWSSPMSATYENQALRIESSAIINLLGVLRAKLASCSKSLNDKLQKA